MKAFALSLGLCLALSPAAFAQSECPAAGSLTFGTTLSGTQFGGQGSPSGFGSGFITLNPLTGQATIDMTVNGIGSNITSAGLFQNGNLFLPFTDTNTTFTNGMLTRTVTLTTAQMGAILANPASFSIGVTTPDFPNGAVTGTLVPLQSLGGTFSGMTLVGTSGAAAGGGAFTGQLVPNPSGSGWILNFSIAPTGIGDNITGVQLFQGGPGTNGTLFASLSGASALESGVVSGSIPLTTQQAIALMSNPSNFYLVTSTSAFPAGAVRAQLAAVQNDLYVPVVGSVNGAAGTQWSTDINIFNMSWSAPATVAVQFLPANQGNATTSGAINPSNTTTVTISPRSVAGISGVLPSLFKMQNGLGALRLVSDQPLVATARIYNNQRAVGRGTLGEILNAKSLCDAVSRGVLVGISGSASGINAFPNRTNIGFFNPTGSNVQVNLGISSQGTVMATKTLTIPPFGMMQLPSLGNGGIFQGLAADINSGAITFQSSAPIFAYASIVDNVSGDTSLVFAQSDTTTPPAP